MTVQPNIVLDYKIGNTRIKIADNYCADKTAEDVKRILRNVARKAQRSLKNKDCITVLTRISITLYISSLTI